MGSLGQALSDIPPEWRLGDTVLSIAPRLDWHQVYRSDKIDLDLTRNIIAAEFVSRCGR